MLLDDVLKDEPKYRAKQAKQAIFRELISDWDEATALPAVLRARLKQEYPLGVKGEVFDSADGRTAKALIVLGDGLKIETVLMKYEEANGEAKRNTVCVSTQVGCQMGCSFCATGKMGFQRNLTADEIAAQVLFWNRYLIMNRDSKYLVSNVVFMGMGEPFLNYENTMEAVRIFNDADCFNIGARKISISTCGVVEGIEKFADEKLQVNLAISLHASNDELRSKLMPINKKYPLEKVLAAVDDYIAKTRRKVMFEYLMIDGVNDSDEQARELAKICKGRLVMVNLIAYNPTVQGLTLDKFEASSEERIKKFQDILMKDGIEAIRRFRFGRDIKAACGQLAGIK